MKNKTLILVVACALVACNQTSKPVEVATAPRPANKITPPTEIVAPPPVETETTPRLADGSYGCKLQGQSRHGDWGELRIVLMGGEYIYTRVGTNGKTTASNGRYTDSGESLTLTPAPEGKSTLFYIDGLLFPEVKDYQDYKRVPGLLRRLQAVRDGATGPDATLPKQMLMVCQAARQ